MNELLHTQRDTLSKLVSLVGRGRKVLCVGSSNYILADALYSDYNCDVTLITDPAEFFEALPNPKIKHIVDVIGAPELPRKFQSNEFEVVIVGDQSSIFQSAATILANFSRHFTKSIVISVPPLQMSDAAVVRTQGEEIHRLRELLRVKEETLNWYSKKMREHLVNHYKYVEKEKKQSETIVELNKVCESLRDSERLIGEDRDRVAAHAQHIEHRLAQKEHEHRELIHQIGVLRHEEAMVRADRDRIVQHLQSTSRYSPDNLPRILRYPVKMLLAMMSHGPLEPIRLARKKKAYGGP